MDVKRKAHHLQALVSSSDHQYHSMQSHAFLLRCCVKENEFENASETLVELRGRMTDVIGRIDATMLERVMDSVVSRAPFSVVPSAGDLADVTH